MEVDDELEAVVTRPCDCLLEVRQLALDVRLAARDVPCPEADWQADVVQAARRSGQSHGTGTMDEKAGVAHPAAAMSAKSCSVIHVSQ